MAEAAAPVLAAACRCFGAEVGHAANTESRRRKLSEQVEELRSLRKDVQKVADNGTKSGLEPTEVALGWLRRADAIIRRADSAVATAEEEKKKSSEEAGSGGGGGGGCWAHGWRRYKLGKRITKVTKEVVRHENKGKELKVLHDEPAPPPRGEQIIKPGAHQAAAAAAGEKAPPENAAVDHPKSEAAAASC